MCEPSANELKFTCLGSGCSASISFDHIHPVCSRSPSLDSATGHNATVEKLMRTSLCIDMVWFLLLLLLLLLFAVVVVVVKVVVVAACCCCCFCSCS